jgi:hypothetical protein
MVIEFILANEQPGGKKSTVESKFGSTSAELLEKMIGSANHGSVKLL